MIKVGHLEKNFEDLETLKGISLTAKEGEKFVIIGLSGSGKLTPIRCINCSEEPISGKITMLGTEVTRESHLKVARKCSSVVLQQFDLYPHLTVVEDLTLAPMRFQHIPRGQAIANATRCLEWMGLKSKADSYPVQLSGGQQQRVTIARALCTKQPPILFDELTSAPDPGMMQEVLNVMAEPAGKNIIMMCITHEMGFARQMADRVVFTDGGCISEEGTSEHSFEAPEHERMKAFLSEIFHWESYLK